MLHRITPTDGFCCVPQVSAGGPWGLAALPHTLWEGWGPYCPCPTGSGDLRNYYRNEKLHHKERFLLLFLQCLLKLCLFLSASVWRAGSLVLHGRAGSAGAGSVGCSASAGPQAWLLRLVGLFLNQGIEPVSPAPTGGFFTTDPPGKP